MKIEATSLPRIPVSTMNADLAQDRTAGTVPDTAKDSNPNEAERRRKFIDALWLVLLLTAVTAISARPSAAMDEDLWWHIRSGAWILAHWAVPTHDPFGAYTTGKNWFAYTWLFDVLVSKVYSVSGLHGILALTTLSMSGCVGAVVVLLSRYGSLLRAIALAASVALVLIPLDAPRPWLFTILFFVVELYLLLQARERDQGVWLLPVVALFALWANVHIQFVYGLGIILLFALEGWAVSILPWMTPSARLGSRWFWAVLLGAFLGTLVNPYGWHIYSVVIEYATQGVPLWFIQEMQAMHFRSVMDWTALVLFSSAIFVTARSNRKCFPIWCLLLIAGWLGFHTERDVWFLAVVSALALASSMGEAEGGLGEIRGVQWAIAAPVSLVLALLILQMGDLTKPILEQAAEKRFPEKASTYIENHRLQTPLYNSFNWGGYLMWRLPHLPVSMDGRANLQGDARLARFADTYWGKKNWAEDPELMKAKTIVLERDSPLASILRSDLRFRLIYEDEIASVFQPGKRQDVVR